MVLSNYRSAILQKFPSGRLERGVLLSGLPNMENFGHFILNGASKFPLIRDQLNAGWSAIVPGKRAPFHDAIIDYCGFDRRRFVFTEANRGLRVGHLDVI